MKQIASFIALLFFLFASSAAQQLGANVSFNELKHDFGQINENGGEVTYNFKFTNTGNQPLILNNVKPSCGCTSPKWSKEPVLPGGNGFIEVKFNPEGRPGPFNKSVHITSNANDPNAVLYISGNVLESEKTLEETYRYQMGDIRMTKSSVYFSRIFPDEIKTSAIDIVNVSDEDIKPQFRNVPNGLKVVSVPEILKPQEKGKIQVTYDTKGVNNWGRVDYSLFFSTDGTTYKNRLRVIANVQEDFSKLSSEELANAPKAVFEETNYDFGNIKQGEKVEYEYTLTNQGKTNLIIRKVSASCGCTAVNPDKNIIPPGESTKIKVVFDSYGRKGTQKKTVTVITNDPKNTNRILYLSGSVVV